MLRLRRDKKEEAGGRKVWKEGRQEHCLGVAAAAAQSCKNPMRVSMMASATHLQRGLVTQSTNHSFLVKQQCGALSLIVIPSLSHVLRASASPSRLLRYLVPVCLSEMMLYATTTRMTRASFTTLLSSMPGIHCLGRTECFAVAECLARHLLYPIRQGETLPVIHTRLSMRNSEACVCCVHAGPLYA